MRISRLDHIQIAMPKGQEESARFFYSSVLGFTEIPKPKTLVSRGGCWFQGPDLEIHLGIETDFQPARKAHPAFIVESLEEAKQILQNVGIEYRMDTAIPTVTRLFTHDPFGNRIELIQR